MRVKLGLRIMRHDDEKTSEMKRKQEFVNVHHRVKEMHAQPAASDRMPAKHRVV